MRILRHRDFRYLWLAQSTSFIGDGIVVVALALYVVQQTGSAADLGLVLAAQSLPLVGFLLVGGAWADRLPRHRVMVATDIVRFALHGTLALLIFSGGAAVWQLVAIEAAFGAAEAFFRPAANGLLPQTVPEEDIQQATATSSMSSNVAGFLGPVLATALVVGVGAGWAFALDAATFVVSALLLMRVRPRVRAGEERSSAPAESVLESIREGAREVRSHVWVLATLACFSVALFFMVAPWYVLGPGVAGLRYGSTSTWGVCEIFFGLGTVAGAIAGIGWRPRYPMRLAMIVIMPTPVVIAVYALGAPLAFVLPANVISGVGFALFDVWWLTALAERIAPERLSRVTSYDWMVSGGLLPLGYAIAGPVGSALGSVNVMVGGSALGLIAFALGLLPRETRMLERLHTGPEPLPAEEGVASLRGYRG